MASALTQDQINLSTLSAKNQMAFQERMSNSAHVREVQDLKNAGLNPVLSSRLGGASTPSGALGDYSGSEIGNLLATSLAVNAKALTGFQKVTEQLIQGDRTSKELDYYIDLIENSQLDSNPALNLPEKLLFYGNDFLTYMFNGLQGLSYDPKADYYKGQSWTGKKIFDAINFLSQTTGITPRNVWNVGKSYFTGPAYTSAKDQVQQNQNKYVPDVISGAAPSVMKKGFVERVLKPTVRSVKNTFNKWFGSKRTGGSSNY